MSARELLAASLALWLGVSLLLSDAPWFRRRSLRQRLGPYVSVRRETHKPLVPAGDSLAQVLIPLSKALAETLARWMGATEDAEVRLRRIHSDLPVSLFRMRQLAYSVLALFGAVALSASGTVPTALDLAAVVAFPLVTFLAIEQRLARASDAWRQHLLAELPVVSEQLAMLLAAGYSTGAAIGRLAARSRGATGTDLGRVQRRVLQGASLDQALREWADLSQVEALNRLVAVLTLHSEATDLSRLVSEEADTIRQESHRRLVSAMEKRAEQVWVPVTVAALVPGSIFLAVPFFEALRLFSLA